MGQNHLTIDFKRASFEKVGFARAADHKSRSKTDAVNRPLSALLAAHKPQATLEIARKNSNSFRKNPVNKHLYKCLKQCRSICFTLFYLYVVIGGTFSANYISQKANTNAQLTIITDTKCERKFIAARERADRLEIAQKGGDRR